MPQKKKPYLRTFHYFMDRYQFMDSKYRLSADNRKAQLQHEKEVFEKDVENSLNGTNTKTKHYLKQIHDHWHTLKYCRYCGTELVSISFSAFCGANEDTGFYYCMGCNIETKDFMLGVVCPD